MQTIKEETHEHLFRLRLQQLPLDINSFTYCGKLQRKRLGGRALRQLHSHSYRADLQHVEERHACEPVVR